MVQQLLQAYHDSPWAGHFGYRRTYWKLKNKCWWPKMKSSIQNYISACLPCQQFNIDRQKSVGFLHSTEPPQGRDARVPVPDWVTSPTGSPLLQNT